MYGAPGRAYVYFTYGMHHLLNVVTRPEGDPQAVLIRALEPAEGIETMRHRRTNPRTGSAPNDRDLANGPGKLCQALAIDKSFYGADLTGRSLWIEPGPPVAAEFVACGARVGVDYAGTWTDAQLRFWLRDNPYVSRAGR